MEITTESPLLPWLVRHCAWILSRCAVRADGRTGYSRLVGRECTSGIARFGEAIWYKLPKTADLTKLDDRWRTAIWLGKSDRSDDHIIGLETGAVLSRLSSCAQEKTAQLSPEPRRGSQLHRDPAAPNLVSTTSAAQASGVDTEAMETEDTEPAMSSQAPAVAAPIRPSVTR